jgi:hypothetical protein
VQNQLVFFDLLKAVAAFFCDDAGGFALIMQRIGGNDQPVKRREPL